MSVLESLKGKKIIGVISASEHIPEDCLVFENGVCLFLNKWEPAPLEEARDVLARQQRAVEQAATSYKNLCEATDYLKEIEAERDKQRQKELESQAPPAPEPAVETAAPQEEVVPLTLDGLEDETGDTNGTGTEVQPGAESPPA